MSCTWGVASLFLMIHLSNRCGDGLYFGYYPKLSKEFKIIHLQLLFTLGQTKLENRICFSFEKRPSCMERFANLLNESAFSPNKKRIKS